MSAFLLRVVEVEFYNSVPIIGCDKTVSALKRTAINSVPVVQVFGITETGQKVCAHVHNAFPYLYVGGEHLPEAKTLCDIIERFLCPASAAPTSRRSSAQQFVYDIHFCHLSVFDAVKTGTIGNGLWDVFEAHIPYTLQFMIDYNLGGMNWMRIESFKFRRPFARRGVHCVPELLPTTGHIWNADKIPSELYHVDLSILALTYCELELDCDVGAISNGQLGPSPENAILAIIGDGVDLSDVSDDLMCGGEERTYSPRPGEVEYLNSLRALLPHQTQQTQTFRRPSQQTANLSVVSLDESLVDMGEELLERAEHISPLDQDSILGTGDVDSDTEEQDQLDELEMTQCMSQLEESALKKMEKYTQSLDTFVVDKDANDNKVPQSNDSILITRSTKIELIGDAAGLNLSGKLPVSEHCDKISLIKSSQSSSSSEVGAKASKNSPSSPELFTDPSTSSSNEGLDCGQRQSGSTVESVAFELTSQEDVESLTPIKSDDTQREASPDLFEVSATTPMHKEEEVVNNSGGDGFAFSRISASSTNAFVDRRKRRVFQLRGVSPPTKCDVERWLQQRQQDEYCGDGSQPSVSDQSTMEHTERFKLSFADGTLPATERQYVTLMAVEVHVQTRGDLCPDPTCDPIVAIFFCVQSDDEIDSHIVGVIGMQNGLDASQIRHFLETEAVSTSFALFVDSETVLLDAFVDVVRKYDPDIVIGYETTRLSWAYVLSRAAKLHHAAARGVLSRVICTSQHQQQSTIAEEGDQDSMDDYQQFKLAGRVALELWRIVRKQVAVTSYSFESAYFNIFHERTPKFSYKELSSWWPLQFDSAFNQCQGCNVQNNEFLRVVRYYRIRVEGVFRIMDNLQILCSHAEMARLFGIKFFEVFSRGSQFRVESMMLRAAHRNGYIALSPSIGERGAMRAPGYIPLVLEPQSGFYTDCVIVLDFQSLYPSIIIGHNYCFTTCLGFVSELTNAEDFQLGCSKMHVPFDLFTRLCGDHVTVSPAGAVFVKPYIRRGVLPTMLQQILSTRIMVKKKMKSPDTSPAMKRILDARQLALKLIANVTYGYTAANYSGRMPLVELADSIVSKGREALEDACKLVRTTEKWKCDVVYGDTDSLFVRCNGSLERAFKIGQEIADAVTRRNPVPMKLVLEKVYLPCILESKKRYVGYKYESATHAPKIDAKGIETIRRDGCPLVSKTLEKALQRVFEAKSVDAARPYLQNVFKSLLRDRVPLDDFVFAREYRGKARYRDGACVPALTIANRMSGVDYRSEPLTGDRVPYVIVTGQPRDRLIDRAVDPLSVARNPRLRIHIEYYINNVLLPALERASFWGKATLWYRQVYGTVHRPMPTLAQEIPRDSRERVLYDYFAPQQCPICDAPVATKSASTANPNMESGLCPKCTKAPAFTVQNTIRKLERRAKEARLKCQNCAGFSSRPNLCVSIDCPNMFVEWRSTHKVEKLRQLKNLRFKLSDLDW